MNVFRFKTIFLNEIIQQFHWSMEMIKFDWLSQKRPISADWGLLPGISLEEEDVKYLKHGEKFALDMYLENVPDCPRPSGYSLPVWDSQGRNSNSLLAWTLEAKQKWLRQTSDRQE